MTFGLLLFCLSAGALGQSQTAALEAILRRLERDVAGTESERIFKDILEWHDRAQEEPSDLRGRGLDAAAEAVATHPSSNRLILKLLQSGETMQLGLQAVGRASAKGPLSPVVSAALARIEHLQGADWAPTRAALLGVACRRLQDGPESDEDAFLAATQRRLAALVEAGLPSEAAAILDALPESLRQRLEREGPLQGRLILDGLPVSLPGEEVRPELALAYHLEGRPTDARRVVEGLPAPAADAPKDFPESSSYWERRLRRELLRAVLDIEQPADSYDFASLFYRPQVSHFNSPVQAPVWAELMAEYAWREGFDSFADYHFEIAARTTGIEFPYRGSFPWENPAFQVVRGEALALLEARKRRMEALQQRRVADAEGSDAYSQRMAQLLQTPAGSVVREISFAAGERDASAVDQRLAAFTRGIKLPAGFNLVAAGRDGDRLVAVCTSRSLDNTGEHSEGGYWALQSFDGGAVWSRPFYLGLRVNQPYWVPTGGLIGIGSSGEVTMEVEIRELDTSILTFPPMGSRFKRRETGKALVFSMDDVQRDRDSDGLTDLEEERLLTDPDLTDSDGDGLRDGEDPLPQVAFSGDSGIRAGAMSAFLAAVLPSAGRNAGVERGSRLNADALVARTTFIVGNRADFQSVLSDTRIVVLTAAEFEQVGKKFGLSFPVSIHFMLFDAEVKRALAPWDMRWRGGTVELQRSGTSWHAETISQWIT